MRATLTALVVLVVVALALPTAAQAQLPVGSANGVKIVRDRGIVVVFTQRATKLWRQVAGRRVTVKCTELMDPDDSGLQSTFSGEFRPSARRGAAGGCALATSPVGSTTATVHLAPRTVGKGERRRRLSREWIVSIPLSQVGAVFLDELQRSWAMMSLLLGAELLGDRNPGDGFFTPAELRDPRATARQAALAACRRHGQRAARPRRRGPSATGATAPKRWPWRFCRRAAGGCSSSSSEDDVLRTNVAGYIYSDIDDF